MVQMATALLCFLLMGHHVLAVVNKSPAQQTINKETSDKKEEVTAEDRILSDVYGAPPQLSNEYGPPLGGEGFNGPAPVYGPPELTGNHGPVQVYPPPPPELPPPPPQSYGPPRKVKPHYGPPKQSYGPPPGIGPKPGYGPPKLQFGPPPLPFGSSRPLKPQYGPPLKFTSFPNLQYGPPRFGGSKPGGHGPPIPISLETYGPPTKGPLLSFDSAPQQDYGPPPAPIAPPQAQYGPPAGDLYGPPPPPPPPGVPAPPTPPDIKYDGWQPIAGLVGVPNHHGQPADSYGPPDSSYEHFSSHGSSGSSSSHLSGDHSSSLILDSGKSNVPSDSYGEPIHNPDAQHLKSSVHESNAHGLPPPQLPQSEPLHNNQGPAKSIPGHQEHHHHESSHQNHQFGNNGLLDTQYGAPIGGDLKAPGFEILPQADALTGDLHGLSLSEGSSSSFGSSSASSFASSSSNSFRGDIGSTLSLPALPHETYGTPLNSGGNHEAHGLQGGGDDFTLQQLPLHGSSDSYTVSFSGASFGGASNINSGLSLPPPPPLDSYGAPPASSYSPNGPYPSSQGARGGSWLSGFNHFGSTNFHKQHTNGHHHHHHHRNHGPPPPRHGGPPLPVTGGLIPPRNRAPIKFREPIPSGLLANINRYLPPVSKPSINYGAPLNLEQQLPSLNGPLHFQSSSSHSFGNSLSSGSLFAKGNSLLLNSPIAAPNVHYGTPLSFNDFNTPAPVLTYGAPNFGPATSFVSTSIGGFGAGGNLYNNIASNAVSTTYGTPVLNGGGSPIPAGGVLGGHDCGFQKSGGQASGLSEYNGFIENAGRPVNSGHQSLANSLQSSGAIASFGHGSQQHQEHHHQHHQQHQQQQQQQQNSVHFNNAGSVNSALTNSQHFTSFPAPSINELDLESHEQQGGDLKDSYGNPIALSLENLDQTGAALTTNDIHAAAVSASSGYSQESSQHSHQHQNSFASGATFLNADGISAEALTAALTAQGYGQGKNFVSNELVQDAGTHFSKVHEGSNEALALAQTLQAEGADGFQIQGSKGTYTLQIQAADGGLGTENSDGSIRHDQVLSNGLLQDILAAIEQPGNGPVEIQGPPQAQQLQEVYGDAIANGHQINVQQQPGLSGNHEEIVDQVLSAQTIDDPSDDIHKPIGPEGHVALFYDNNNGYEDSKKEIRSTSKSEGQIGASSNEKSDEKTSSNSQAEATKKSS